MTPKASETMVALDVMTPKVTRTFPMSTALVPVLLHDSQFDCERRALALAACTGVSQLPNCSVSCATGSASPIAWNHLRDSIGEGPGGGLKVKLARLS